MDPEVRLLIATSGRMLPAGLREVQWQKMTYLRPSFVLWCRVFLITMRAENL
jgi:hypothetical protein